MKMVSMLALAAAAMTLGAAAPAMAQKKDAQEQAPLKVGAEYRKVGAEAEAAVKAKDYATAATKISALETLAKNDDERFYAAELGLQVALAQGNVPNQLKVIEVLLASPRTTPERARALGAHQQFLLGSKAIDDKEFAKAIPMLLKARELGSTQIDLSIMLANAYSNTGKSAESVAEVDRAIQRLKAEGKAPPESWYRFAIPRVNALGDRAATAAWMSRLLADYPTVQNWRWGIVNYREGKNRAGEQLDTKQKIDLFRLMRFTGALADQQDYFDYAKAAIELGLPWEAISAIDEGREAKVIPAGHPDFGKVYSTAQTGVKNEGSLDQFVKAATSASDGKQAANTADAFLASANYAKALELYDMALSKGGSIDTAAVNLHRGEALVGLNRKDEAKTAFASVKGRPLEDIAGFWTTWLSLPGPLKPAAAPAAAPAAQ